MQRCPDEKCGASLIYEPDVLDTPARGDAWPVDGWCLIRTSGKDDCLQTLRHCRNGGMERDTTRSTVNDESLTKRSDGISDIESAALFGLF